MKYNIYSYNEVTGEDSLEVIVTRDPHEVYNKVALYEYGITQSAVSILNYIKELINEHKRYMEAANGDCFDLDPYGLRRYNAEIVKETGWKYFNKLINSEVRIWEGLEDEEIDIKKKKPAYEFSLDPKKDNVMSDICQLLESVGSLL